MTVEGTFGRYLCVCFPLRMPRVLSTVVAVAVVSMVPTTTAEVVLRVALTKVTLVAVTPSKVEVIGSLVMIGVVVMIMTMIGSMMTRIVVIVIMTTVAMGTLVVVVVMLAMVAVVY
eukprot:Rmarinus@m.21448